MILTRDKGQRMWGGGGGSSYSYGGGGGGESPSFDGFVSKEYYNQNFELLYKQEVTVGGTTTTSFMTAAPNIIVPVGTVTDETTQTTTVTSLVGPVAKNAIVLGNIMMVYDQTNNAIKVVNRDGSTAANFYATGGVSALGYNPGGGGGGGADLNALLDSINSSSIGDIAPSASEVGKCLVYNGNNQWAWATPGGGGGLTYGLSWSYGSVTGAQGGSYDGSATSSFVIPKDTSHLSNNAGFITSAALSGYLNIGSDGVVEGGQYYDFHVQGTTADFATRLQASGTYNNTLTFPSEDGVIATRNWVNQQGFLTSETYRGTVTSVGLSMPTGFSVSGSPVTSSGTLSVGISSGYFMPTTTQRTTWNNKQDAISDLATIRSNASHGQTAYGWGNHANAGYLLRTEGMRFTSYGNYIAARFVNADGTYDATRAAKAQGDGYIEWWSDGGYFNHEMGFIRAKGNVEVGTSTTDTAHYLQIGGGRLFWDNTNNALYVQKADGTACHLYATGGVSALGMSVGGTPSMNALTLQNLTVNGSATIGTLVVTNDVADLTVTTMNIGNELWLNGNSIYMDSGKIEDAYQVQTTQMIVGSGGSTIKKIYWDGTYLQVQIGSTTYKFRPDATA